MSHHRLEEGSDLENHPLRKENSNVCARWTSQIQLSTFEIFILLVRNLVRTRGRQSQVIGHGPQAYADRKMSDPHCSRPVGFIGICRRKETMRTVKPADFALMTSLRAGQARSHRNSTICHPGRRIGLPGQGRWLTGPLPMVRRLCIR